MAAFVDGIGVLLALARSGLPGVTVASEIPDNLPTHVPLLVINHVGGSSTHPEFSSVFTVQLRVWSDRTVDYPDPDRAAFELARSTARVFRSAYLTQTVATDGSGELGWLAAWSETFGFQRLPDEDVPFLGSYVAVYDFRVRNPRT